MTTIEIAGWRVQLDCRPADLADTLAARYAGFLTTKPPGMTASVTWEKHADSGSLRLDDLPAVRAAGDGKGFRLDGPGFSAAIDEALATASLVIRSADHEGGVEYFLRVLYALLAHRHGGLLLHAAGLLLNGRPGDAGWVYLFIGQSGSGKSTVVRLSPRARAMNDELVLLRPAAGGWLAYGTPFWNSEACARQDEASRGPVAGIYKLVQDAEVFVEPMPGAIAVAELIANCPVVNSDPRLLPGALALCRRLAHERAVYWLHFRESPDFWSLLPDAPPPQGNRR